MQTEERKSLPLFRRKNLDDEEIERKDEICRMMSNFKPKKKKGAMRLIDLPKRLFTPSSSGRSLIKPKVGIFYNHDAIDRRRCF